MSPNIRYINQSAPFWDWIASFEDTAADHPFFAGPSGQAGPSGPPPHGHHPPHPPHPAHHGHSWGPWGRRHDWHGHLPHHGPPPPSGAPGEEEPSSSDEKRDKPEEPVADPPEDTPQPPCEGHPARRGRHGRCGGDRRSFGGHGFSGHGFGGRGFGRHHGHPYARWGFPGRGGFGMLGELFQPAAEGDNDWKPEADVFDTESSYMVHVSLPGANKEDIGVSWDPEKSELTVSGVVHRPGDEEFLKTLALDERKVGAFERKIRLGTRANPAQVDLDGITAKLENGILFIDVPKMNGEFVEIKKVDIE